MADTLIADAGEPEEPEDLDTYPPDDEDDDWDEDEDGGEDTVPKPRMANARKAMLQRGKTTVKGPKTVAKTGKRILARQKQRQALELRKAGASYAQIAEQLGYKDASGASKAVKRAFGNVIQEPVTDLKTIQIERLNHMLLVIWPKVQTGDDRAIHTARGIMSDLNDLMGTRESSTSTLDVNVSHSGGVLVVEGNSEEYIRALKQMAGINADGSNATPALEQGTTSLQDKQDQRDDVIDGEVVEAGWEDNLKAAMKDGDSLRDHLSDQDVDTIHRIMSPPSDEPIVIDEPAQPAKKKFKFGVDPTVRREK